MCLKYFVKAYKSSKVHAYIALEVTMTLILKMESFKCFVNQKVYTIIYRHRELLNKMGLWNEEHNTQGDARIMLFKALYQNTSGQKQLTLLVMCKTKY